MNSEKIYGNPQFDKPEDYLTEEEFLNKKLDKKTVQEIEEVYPGFKEKYAQVYNSGKVTKEVAEMIANANVLTKDQIKKLDIKKSWKEKISSNNLAEKDIKDLSNTLYSNSTLDYPEKENEEQGISEEHKEFCAELKEHTYTPEEAAKNTAVREQRELSKEIQQEKQMPEPNEVQHTI
ncbi:MAG: hypothetical protein J6A15_03085 [Clostridia bacterium]|nr:hypothetical protein [Clostridia bacterium]